ncbi:lITAF domain-containing protein [Lycodopsis pacificus]
MRPPPMSRQVTSRLTIHFLETHVNSFYLQLYTGGGGGLEAGDGKRRFVSYDGGLGNNPGMTTCTSCQQQVMTNVTYKAGTYAWLMCLLFICCGLILCCCLIPFFMNKFKDAYHTCPRCNRVLHVEKKQCCK